MTALKAIDLESELPPADSPIERTGGDFQIELPSPRGAAPAVGLEALSLRAERDGLEAVLTVELPEAGLYTLSALVVTGKGQRWLADGCRKAILCPSARAGWRAVMSQSFAAGRHSFTVTLADGAVVERVRLERKKDGGQDYLAALRRLGFDAGPPGAVSWDKAAAAMQFIQDRRRLLLQELCGDVELPEPADASTLVAHASPAAPPTTPAGPSRPAPPALPGIVLLPPQETASPDTPLLAAEVVGPRS